MLNKEALLRQLRLWHRRLGLTLLLWLVLVATTGIAINHTKDFALETKHMPRLVLETIYGISAPEIRSFAIEDRWFSLVAAQQLYVDDIPIGPCENFLGVAGYNGEYFAACRGVIFIVNSQGELLEKLAGGYGVPTPIDAFGLCDNSPCLQSRERLYRFDGVNFTWRPLATGMLLPSHVSQPPEDLLRQLQAHHIPPDLGLERLLRDLHSGVFFGLGPWIMDLFAATILVLSLIGLALWILGRRR